MEEATGEINRGGFWKCFQQKTHILFSWNRMSQMVDYSEHKVVHVKDLLSNHFDVNINSNHTLKCIAVGCNRLYR